MLLKLRRQTVIFQGFYLCRYFQLKRILSSARENPKSNIRHIITLKLQKGFDDMHLSNGQILEEEEQNQAINHEKLEYQRSGSISERHFIKRLSLSNRKPSQSSYSSHESLTCNQTKIPRKSSKG